MKTQPQFAATCRQSALTLLLSALTVLACGAGADASTVTTLNGGLPQTDLGPGWRDPSVPKLSAADPNGDHVYGSDGYYCYGTPYGGSSAQVITSLPSLPSYISSVTVPGGTPKSDGSPASLNDPSQPIGTPHNMASAGVWYVQSQSTGVYRDFFTITLAAPSTFVLTTIVDGWSTVNYWDPQGVRVTGSAGPATVTGFSPSDSIPDYAFFVLSGNAGDQFTVAFLTTSTGTLAGAATTSGLGFEQLIPEPSTILLLSIGGLVVFRVRRLAGGRGRRS